MANENPNAGYGPLSAPNVTEAALRISLILILPSLAYAVVAPD